MRIIAGQFKGLIFEASNYGKMRPMSERGRIAVFNMLADLSEYDLVLDAYGGTGALGFEALSRGVKKAVIIEIDRRAYKQLVKNIDKLKLNHLVDNYRANNVTCVSNLGLKYDLMFLDPPYDNPKAENLLSLSQFLKPDGLLVLSHPPHFKSPFNAKYFVILNDKKYANLHIKIYRKI